jgi:hypothetical protein
LDIDIKRFFKYIQISGGKCTRFDLSYDDFFGDHCDLFKIYEYAKIGNYCSSLDYMEYILSSSHKTGCYKGHTLTFGKSKIVLQIYDKKLERESVDNADVWTPFWHRYEIRFKEDIGNTIFYQYCKLLNSDNFENDLIEFYFSRLYQIIDFKEITDNKTNLSMNDTAGWWSDFIGDHLKIKIRSQFKVESSILTKKKWIKNSVAKPFAKVIIADGKENFMKEFDIELEQATDKLENIDYLEILKYQKDLEKEKEFMASLTEDERLSYIQTKSAIRQQKAKEKLVETQNNIKNLKFSS